MSLENALLRDAQAHWQEVDRLARSLRKRARGPDTDLRVQQVHSNTQTSAQRTLWVSAESNDPCKSSAVSGDPARCDAPRAKQNLRSDPGWKYAGTWLLRFVFSMNRINSDRRARKQNGRPDIFPPLDTAIRHLSPYDGASSEAYLVGWALSAAVEMALKAVTLVPLNRSCLVNQFLSISYPLLPSCLIDPSWMPISRPWPSIWDTTARAFVPTRKPQMPRDCQAADSRGAVGICTAKVSEAAVMANAGIGSILVTSPISTRDKAQVVNAIATEQLELLLVVDSIEGMLAMQAEIDDDTRIGLLLDLDASTGRTGIRDSDLLLRLLDDIQSDARFYFAGVQHYAGHVMHVHDFEDRRDKSMRAWERLADKFELLDRQGMRPQIVTGGGTGTFDIDVTLNISRIFKWEAISLWMKSTVRSAAQTLIASKVLISRSRSPAPRLASHCRARLP